MALPTMKRGTHHDELHPDAESQVTSLLEVLDEDIRHVEATLMRLDTLRGLLIKRDDKSLDRLLEEIHREGETYVATERRRQGLRQDLARVLGWEEQELTVSNLLTQVTGGLRTALIERQTRLKMLIARLKREHRLTTLLLSDCRRFNRSLLHVFLGPAGKTGTTYSPTGAAKHATGMVMLNMQL